MSSSSHIGFVRACVVSDENRSRSNGSETRDRCRLVRTPGLSYARRSFPPIDLLTRSSPDLGAGEHLRPAGKREPVRGGRAKNEEKKRACFSHPFSHSLCSSVSRSRLVIVAVCGIPCRLVSRLVVPSRSVVSFSVCFFRFRLGASRSSVSFYFVSPSVLSSCFLTSSCLRFLTRFAHLRSSSSLSSSSSSFVSLPPVASVGVFVLVIRLSPSCVSCSLGVPLLPSSRCPI